MLPPTAAAKIADEIAMMKSLLIIFLKGITITLNLSDPLQDDRPTTFASMIEFIS